MTPFFIVFAIPCVVVVAVNLVIDNYAKRVTKQTTQVADKFQEQWLHYDKSNVSGGDSRNIHNKSASQLRDTFDRRSGLVLNLEDRLAWNEWIIRSNKTLDDDEPRDEGMPNLEPGVYEFRYRTYANFEEALAMKKRLFHLPTWIFGHVQPKPGTITMILENSSSSNVDDPTCENDQICDREQVQDTKRLQVTNDEYVIFRCLKHIHIQWTGYWDSESRCIIWTSSHMTIRNASLRQFIWKLLKWRRKKTRGQAHPEPFVTVETTERPEMSERLRQIPWEVTKVEDGMVVFRRGDVGFLVYDWQKEQ